VRSLQPRLGEGHLSLFLGQRGDLGDGRGDLRSQALHLREVDTQAPPHPRLSQRGDAAQPALDTAEEPADAVGPA